jgi:hypothetical protein
MRNTQAGSVREEDAEEVNGDCNNLHYEAIHKLHCPENTTGGYGGYSVGQLVEALCYKLEGRRFDSR